ncbi:MAG: hypothetical protein EA385_12790 [Salinarimonadaceae bacterium]|nr:MAG: hypothetical protein EA385_12790 [Salinarimonadaceae bacterium]
MTQPNDEATESPGEKPGARSVVQDRVLAILIIVVATFFWIESGRIRAAEAQMFPRMILILIYGLAGLLALRTLYLQSDHRAPAIITSYPAFALFVLTSLVYVSSVSSLGFFTASVVYMPVVAFLLGLRRHGLNIAVTFIFLAATYTVFVVIFARPLPREMLWGL